MASAVRPFYLAAWISRYAHITDETLREAVTQLEEWVVLERDTQAESE
jgi:hypothetical protein